MISLITGALMILAAVLLGLFLGSRKSSKNTAKASKGSVAITGDAEGPISAVNVNAQDGPPGWERGLGIVAAIVGILGFALTIWSLLS